MTLIALLNTGVFLWAFAQLRPAARRTLAGELEEGRELPPSAVAETPDGTVGVSGAPGPAGAAAGIAAGPPAAAVPARRLAPAWFDRPSWSEVGPIAWLRAKIDETPIRPDRSRQLATEGRGRLDRLDLWILIVLVVAAMGLRMFRLSEPARMHFDEVYHARTAAEFLQDWRYGLSHYIYE